MAREFYTWPHTARGIVEESLREFVGDGEGEDYEVLTAFIKEVQAEALRDWIREWPTTPGDGTFLADVARDGLARADRLAAEGGADRG